MTILKIIVVATVIIQACSSGNTGNVSAEEARRDSVLMYFNIGWAEDKLWEDGFAEVAKYDAQRVIYGKVRHFEYVFATVKEHFNKEYKVKTDEFDRDDLFEVMKVNKFARIETEEYPYHFLNSIFLKRDNPVFLYKMTNTSQEWCGNTFKEFLEDRYIYRFIFSSYRDGEGDGYQKLPKDVLFEDQLPYTLRTLRFENGLSFQYKVVESQITNKALDPKMYAATFQVRRDTATSDGWQVIVDLQKDKKNVYWFSGLYPNYLTKMEAWDGRTLHLTSLERYDYWSKEE